MALASLLQGGIADWAGPFGPLGLIVHHSLLLFSVINPIGNIPVYVDLTRELEPRERARVLNLAVLIAFLVVIVFAVLGDWILAYLFNVHVSELEIAGGILLFIIALRGILLAGPAYQHPKDRVMVAVFPIAFPIMVGPGAITVTIITAHSIGQILMVFTASAAFALVFLIARNSHRLMRLIGPYAGTMIAKLLYIFLAAKAVGMVLDGTGDFLGRYFPQVQAVP
ncbi:MAG: MarC family protein [Planctomycetes bacterium]|jgi:multiple antibiotic resistance protein|nr:MarC family protein [Planctomycetota bacterium]